MDSFRDLFSLQLRNGGQNSQDGASHRSVGVDLLGDRHEVLASADKNVLDQSDEIAYPAGHSIKTRHTYAINLVVPELAQ